MEKIYSQRRARRRGWLARSRFAAGRIGQLRIADEKIRPLPYLSRRADDAGGAHGIHRQARQRIYLLHFAEGVTGMQTKVASNLAQQVSKNPRAHAIAGGRRLLAFPIRNRPSSSRKTRAVRRRSACESNRGKWKIKDLVKRVGEFVKSLADAVKTI